VADRSQRIRIEEPLLGFGRRLACQQVVHRATQSVDITADVGMTGIAPVLLQRRVQSRPAALHHRDRHFIGD
jgi:hypothetical protein